MKVFLYTFAVISVLSAIACTFYANIPHTKEELLLIFQISQWLYASVILSLVAMFHVEKGG